MASRGRDAARRRRSALGRFDARQGATLLCGVDEVGRGPLAGPVIAAAVILDPGVRLLGIDDSKRLTPAVREPLAQAIHDQARAVSLGIVDAGQIDRLNIRQATFLAMRQALAALAVEPSLVLVDGHETLPALTWPQRPVIGGDRRSLTVAAASVVAKVYRDRLMVDYDEQYPGYGFAAHKGYGTAEHLDALTQLGPCPIHRRSFAPVRLLSQGVLL